jgi:pimeloyl-ACP methyl ester carboxylesterase
MVKRRPDLFHLYVGMGQLVGEQENQASAVARLRALAETAGDQPTLTALAALGPPPWTNPRNFGILRRLTRAYEAKAVDPAPTSWWVPDPAYATPSYEAEYEAGEDYSYLQFVGANGNGLLASINLRELGPRFEVPIHLVQGAEDLVTTPDVARAWFDTIEAPRKEYVLIPRAGHDPNQAALAAVRAILDGHADQMRGSRLTR